MTDTGSTSALSVRELLPPATALAHPALATLRLDYRDQAVFVTEVDCILRAEGYRLVGGFSAAGVSAVAAAGFRVGHSLARGRFLYVDDLATVAAGRRQGYAGALLEWIVHEAERLGCSQIHLDSVHGDSRVDAHRLYFNHGFAIRSHHFVREVHVA